MAIRVGRWDCSTCGTTGVLGPETRCPNCGAPRPPDVRFYLPEDAEVVQDAARTAQALAGADWICGHCRAQNRAAQSVCTGCGNPRDESSRDAALQVREFSPHELPRTAAGVAPARPLHPDLVPPQKGRHARQLLIALLGLAAAIFLAGRIPKSFPVQVSAFRWERSIQMEHYEWVTHEDWQTPAGARNVSAFQAIHHYDQIFRGYETRYRTVQVAVGTETYVCGSQDMGNGYFQDRYCTRTVYESREEPYQEAVYESVPVYATKYRYEVMEWVAKPAYLLQAAGEDQRAKWPTHAPPDPNNWREQKRTAAYFVQLQDKRGRSYTEQVGPQYWQTLRTGQELKGRKSWLFGGWWGIQDSTKTQ